MQRAIALVTGVSRLDGIGKTICCELAKKGFDIFFTYWRPYDAQMPWNVLENEPELIEQEIKQIGVRCERLELDLSQEKSYEVLLNDVETRLGKPSVLINNATYSTQTDIETLSESELDKHYLGPNSSNHSVSLMGSSDSVRTSFASSKSSVSIGSLGLNVPPAFRIACKLFNSDIGNIRTKCSVWLNHAYSIVLDKTTLFIDFR